MALASSMGNRDIPAQVPAEDSLDKPCEEVAGVAPGIHVEEEMAPRLQGEGPMGQPTHGTSKESPEPLSNLPPRQGVASSLGIKALDPLERPILFGEQFPSLKEDLLTIGSAKNQVKKVPSLVVGDSFPLFHLLGETPDLKIHHLAQPQAPGHGLSRIFSSQDFGGQVPGSDYLQQRKSNYGRNLPLASRTPAGLRTSRSRAPAGCIGL
jgi:hypothetical protein